MGVVSPVPRVGELNSLTGETASVGPLCISMKDPRRYSLCVVIGILSSGGKVERVTSAQSSEVVFWLEPFGSETTELDREEGLSRGGLGGGRRGDGETMGVGADGCESAMGYLRETGK